MRLAFPGTSTDFHPVPPQMGHSGADCDCEAMRGFLSSTIPLNSRSRPIAFGTDFKVVHRKYTECALRGRQELFLYCRSVCGYDFQRCEHQTVTGQAKQYFIASPFSKKPSTVARLRIFFGCFIFMVLLRWGMGSFLFNEHYHRGEFETWLEILLLPTVLSLTYALRFHTMFGWNSLLTLGDDFVERVMFVRFVTVKKRIERHRVRSVREVSRVRLGIHRRGVAVRDRGAFAAWLLGYVFVPATVDDYETIKAKLLNWTPPVS